MLRRGYSNAAVVPFVRPCVDLVNTIKTTPLCVSFLKLGRHVNYDKKMNPIDFEGRRSIYGYNFVNTIET